MSRRAKVIEEEIEAGPDPHPAQKERPFISPDLIFITHQHNPGLVLKIRLPQISIQKGWEQPYHHLERERQRILEVGERS